MKRIAIVMMAALGLAAGSSLASEDLAKKSGCTTCHNVTGAKKMGPSLKDAGAKGEDSVLAALNDKKKHASIKASDDDKKALAKWMASMK
jgi:cytochrome c551/c552